MRFWTSGARPCWPDSGPRRRPLRFRSRATEPLFRHSAGAGRGGNADVNRKPHAIVCAHDVEHALPDGGKAMADLARDLVDVEVARAGDPEGRIAGDPKVVKYVADVGVNRRGIVRVRVDAGTI